MLDGNESAECEQGKLDTRQGNLEVASSEYHIERGFGPANDGEIKVLLFSATVGDGFSYIERLLGGPTGKVIHVAYRLLNDAIGLGIIRFLWKFQYLSHALQRNDVTRRLWSSLPLIPNRAFPTSLKPLSHI